MRTTLAVCLDEVWRRGAESYFEARCTELARRSYALLTGAADSCEAWLICWPPGSAAPWHDHGTARGLARVVSGVLHETRLVPGTAHAAERRWRVGDTIELPLGVRHEVQNHAARAAFSLHVYDPRLSHMTFYERGAAGELSVSYIEEARQW
ncbi:MAG TPA: cysteine dioxygenase family protein [Polyangiales bacterium]|nr:cysteine dioxygenase family protein [Polyangiales bacterium]